MNDKYYKKYLKYKNKYFKLMNKQFGAGPTWKSQSQSKSQSKKESRRPHSRDISEEEYKNFLKYINASIKLLNKHTTTLGNEAKIKKFLSKTQVSNNDWKKEDWMKVFYNSLRSERITEDLLTFLSGLKDSIYTFKNNYKSLNIGQVDNIKIFINQKLQKIGIIDLEKKKLIICFSGAEKIDDVDGFKEKIGTMWDKDTAPDGDKNKLMEMEKKNIVIKKMSESATPKWKADKYCLSTEYFKTIVKLVNSEHFLNFLENLDDILIETSEKWKIINEKPINKEGISPQPFFTLEQLTKIESHLKDNYDYLFDEEEEKNDQKKEKKRPLQRNETVEMELPILDEEEVEKITDEIKKFIETIKNAKKSLEEKEEEARLKEEARRAEKTKLEEEAKAARVAEEERLAKEEKQKEEEEKQKKEEARLAKEAELAKEAARLKEKEQKIKDLERNKKDWIHKYSKNKIEDKIKEIKKKAKKIVKNKDKDINVDNLSLDIDGNVDIFNKNGKIHKKRKELATDLDTIIKWEKKYPENIDDVEKEESWSDFDIFKEYYKKIINDTNYNWRELYDDSKKYAKDYLWWKELYDDSKKYAEDYLWWREVFLGNIRS